MTGEEGEEAFEPSLAYSGGKPWVSYYSFYSGNQWPLYAKYWDAGTQSWLGGTVSPGNGTSYAVGLNAYGGKSKLVDVNGTPIGLIEIDKARRLSKSNNCMPNITDGSAHGFKTAQGV